MTRSEWKTQETVVVRDRMVPDEIDLFDYLRITWKHRWSIVVLCMVAVVTTGAISMLMPPRFVAAASIVPPAESSGGGMGLGSGLLGGAESALLRNVMNVTSAADLYVGILQSRAVADAILDRFDLAHIYDVNGVRYKAERKLRKNTRIDVSDEEIVSITVEDRDPNRAAAIANAYVEELDLQNKRLSAGQATSKRIFLENRLAEIERKLSRIETMPAREAQVQEMLYELLVRELEIAKIEEAKSMPTIQVLDPASPPEVRKARGTIRKAFLAGVLALTFGIFLAFLREYVARQKSSPQRTRSLETLPEPPGRVPSNGDESGQVEKGSPETHGQVARGVAAVEAGECQ